jgi:hypothetical protein
MTFMQNVSPSRDEWPYNNKNKSSFKLWFQQTIVTYMHIYIYICIYQPSSFSVSVDSYQHGYVVKNLAFPPKERLAFALFLGSSIWGLVMSCMIRVYLPCTLNHTLAKWFRVGPCHTHIFLRWGLAMPERPVM